MQTNVVSKEVVWVAKLLWIDLIVRLVLSIAVMVKFIVTYTSGYELFLKLFPIIILWVPVTFGVNHFLLKNNPWAIKFVTIYAGLVTILNISNLIFENFTDNLVVLGWIVHLLIGCVILYFLIKKPS
ncbi:MAG: hypothetical protein WA080_09125 [Sulfuricurvum sp.]